MDPILATEVHDLDASYKSVLVYAWLSYIREVLTAGDENAQRAVAVYVDKTGFALGIVLGESEGEFPPTEEIFIAFRQKCTTDVEYLIVAKPVNIRHGNCTDAICTRMADVDFIAGYGNVVLRGTCSASVSVQFKRLPKSSVYNVQYKTDVLEDCPTAAFLNYIADHSINCFKEFLFEDIVRSKTTFEPPATLQ